MHIMSQEHNCIGEGNTVFSSPSQSHPCEYECHHLTKPSAADKLLYESPPIARNTMENNQVRLLNYRGTKLTSFVVDNRQLICLPQAFDYFLKHLVGGLHTVYTKLKRLAIMPVVCNVEQVRILRGLGAIQPGVNRCKLLAPSEFDVLYDDCTNAGYVALSAATMMKACTKLAVASVDLVLAGHRNATQRMSIPIAIG